MSSNLPEAIKICRVYSPPKKAGVWILIDRLWPRGLKKEALVFDLWLKDIAPSVSLRQWFHKNPQERWHDFARQYVEELKSKDSLIEQIQNTAKDTSVTLFYAAKDPKHNHAIILQEVIRSWPSPPAVEF